jgi:hypothetical protein
MMTCKARCIGEIDGGAEIARFELLWLIEFLVEFGCRAEIQANLPRSLGFTDIYRCPAMGTANFIRVNKASEGLLKGLAALRVLAREVMRHKIKVAGLSHSTAPT